MLTISVDTSRVQKMLTTLQAKQLPFATSLALNSMAFDIMRAERKAFGSIFEHPRPFTANSPIVPAATKATRKRLSVVIAVRPEAVPYLLPYEQGGTHVIPGKLLLDPEAIKLDRYGQLTRKQVANLNQAANDPKVSGIFLGTVHGIYGYWQRTGSGVITKHGNLRTLGLRLLARLEQPGPVFKHLDFGRRGIALVPQIAGPAFDVALAKALATANP